MKKVSAYEATDGTVHKTKIDAAMASLMHLSYEWRLGNKEPLIGKNEADFIVSHRSKVMKILEEINREDPE